VRVAGRWRYVYRAIDQFGQVIDVFVSPRRDATAARRFFNQAINATRVRPVEVTTDKAPVYPAVLEDLLPALHTPVVELDEEQHVQPLQDYVSTVRKSQARMPAAWRRRNDRHVVDPAARHGAGWRPLARRTLAVELAEIGQPRCSSSPRMRW
jgi:transposase-like protein